MKLHNFTKKIWSQFGSTANKRADYLWRLYLKIATIRCEGQYLDIGCGLGQNAIAFGQDCQSIHCLDIGDEGLAKYQATFRLKGISNVSFYQGDAQALPFRVATFDRVSMISVIEHVTNQRLAIQEASRVLKPGGELILQVPNKYFFVDLHTGLPLLHCLSVPIRQWLLTKLGYKGVGHVMNIHIPSKTELTDLIQGRFAKVHILKIIYPADLILSRLRPIYSVFNLIGLFNLVPFGFLFVAEKAKANSESLNR